MKKSLAYLRIIATISMVLFGFVSFLISEELYSKIKNYFLILPACYLIIIFIYDWLMPRLKKSEKTEAKLEDTTKPKCKDKSK
jgi:hypothetical protein